MSYSQSTNFGFAVQVSTQQGVVEGNYDTKTGVQTYFGIPFAKASIDEGQVKGFPYSSSSGMCTVQKYFWVFL